MSRDRAAGLRPSAWHRRVDGAPAGEITPARVQIPTGVHIIALKLKGYQIAKHGVEASEGGTVAVNEILKQQK